MSKLEEVEIRFVIGIKCRKCVQGSAKRWSPGCVNAAGKLRQKW